MQFGWLEFNVPFQHKYGYIRDETDAEYVANLANVNNVYFMVAIILISIFIMILHALSHKMIFAVLDVWFGFKHNVLNC